MNDPIPKETTPILPACEDEIEADTSEEMDDGDWMDDGNWQYGVIGDEWGMF